MLYYIKCWITLLQSAIEILSNNRMSALAKYTRAEVATKNGKNRSPVWIIVTDQVYDVTNYLYEHPGGDSVITDVAGKDATEDFDSVGHSQDARTILAKYKIGELVEEEKHYDANGKKKKKVVAAPPEGKQGRSCINVVTCGLLG